VQSEIGGCVAEDRLLDEEDVDSGGADLLDEAIEEFFFEREEEERKGKRKM